MSNPTNLLYSQDHEWVRIEGETATIGVTDYAQKSLGDIVFIEQPSIGRRVELSEALGTIESVKSVSELFSPVAGEVIAINQELENSAELVNQDPYGEGWICKLKLSGKPEIGELMDAAKYEKFIADTH